MRSVGYGYPVDQDRGIFPEKPLFSEGLFYCQFINQGNGSQAWTD